MRDKQALRYNEHMHESEEMVLKKVMATTAQ